MSHGSFGRNPLPSLVGFGLLLVVGLDAGQELLSAGGESEVLDSDVDALGDDSLSDLLVDDDSDGPRVDVEDGAGSAMVIFIGHALVDRAVDNNVNDVTDLVGCKGSRDVDGSVLLESLSELMPG